MRIFQTKWFGRFTRKENIATERLREAVGRAEGGSVDADLGGGLIKQRVARLGQGRSGGYRTVIAYHTRTRSFFLYGFAKSERDNIDEGELEDFKKLARTFLTMTDCDLERAIAAGELTEVTDDSVKDQI